ncbi:MAG: 2-hydroxyglutaryl-CoA dehydratase D-component [Thermotoga petrophila]|uniref:2-hydroxyglutaryl-CoA dehydratase D-component n=1 Tax=Thermotoga petrophila TaxID=93929 RepID=A0A101EPA3_9THEM|nr:MAG: 2-hydroxyglutaryl-CoA dehydratase D-component [Thermotoga petrophila]
MPLLTVNRLNKSFGGLVALNNFTLNVEEGELVGLIGPNGAGKTTVFNLLTGLYQPTSGSIVFNGHDLKGKPPHLITKMGIARTFQNIRLFGNLSVLDNVKIAYQTVINYGLIPAFFRVPPFSRRESEIEKEALDIMREAYHKLCIRPLPMELYQHVNALYSFHIAPKHYILKAAKSLIKYDKPPENNKKILWLHLAPYYDNELYKIFCRTSKTIVATSEFEWDWLYWQVDPVHPFQSLAKKLMLNPEIGPVEKRIDFVSKLALDFKVDGVIHFNHWGCKQSWGSIHLIKENFEKLGIPFLAIDGDCVDHSNQSSAQFKTRIEAFLEMIE